MTLGVGTRRRLEGTFGSIAGGEIANQIDSGGNPVADNVAELGALEDIAASSVATGGTPDCSAAQVQTGVDAVIADVQADIDTLQAKIDGVISALTTAGIMAS